MSLVHSRPSRQDRRIVQLSVHGYVVIALPGSPRNNVRNCIANQTRNRVRETIKHSTDILFSKRGFDK